MTPDFRSLAEKIVENWISHEKGYVGTFYGNLIENIESALRQVYEQRPKVEIEFPSQDIFCAWVYNGNPSDGDPSPLSCYEWLNANTKIKEIKE